MLPRFALIPVCLAAAYAVFSSATLAADNPRPARPNVILIMADDLGWVTTDQPKQRGHDSPLWYHGFDESVATSSAVPTWHPTPPKRSFRTL